jgi:hypothetical protein
MSRWNCHVIVYSAYWFHTYEIFRKSLILALLLYVQDFHCFFYCFEFVFGIQYMLGKFGILPIIFIFLCVFESCFKCSSCLPYIYFGQSAHCNWCTPLRLYFSFVRNKCFMLFFVLYDIPIYVFLNNFVIVLVSCPKNVNVIHFLFFSLFFFGGFCFCCIISCGYLLLFSIALMIVLLCFCCHV